ncbi:SH3 domain-containing protein [Chlorobaculum sp. 24CR]|uniref:SH3 domain-containing protein n=1 Tax=Chlorobaculum sp. 24CR TaxID=2508878 RepID=UPI0014317115|nr:SH3 domain-containing protein [Chlorobaculum sp. 24CR]
MTSLPGILTGIAAVITAVATLLVTLNNKPDLPPVNPDPPAGQQADPPPDTTAATPQQPGAGTTTPPATQPDEPSHNTVRPLIPPLRIADDRLTIRPQLLTTLVAFNLSAVLDDPHGFAYVHSAKSSSSKIVAKINSNEKFSTYNQKSEAWWKVKTASGQTGYLEASKIKVLSD